MSTLVPCLQHAGSSGLGCCLPEVVQSGCRKKNRRLPCTLDECGIANPVCVKEGCKACLINGLGSAKLHNAKGIQDGCKTPDRQKKKCRQNLKTKKNVSDGRIDRHAGKRPFEIYSTVSEPKKKVMVKEEPVSLLRQTIYCIIPILDIYAAYRVKRLRWYLVIMLVFVGIPTLVIDSMLFPPDENMAEGLENVMLFYYGTDDGRFEFSIISHVATVLIAIFFIRRWSHQWNKKFS